MELIDRQALLFSIQERYCKGCERTGVQCLACWVDDMAREIEDAPTVDAVILPYPPKPMLKDRNPFNTDVYCPECGTNLSGYYGEDPLPIITCFACGEILDPYKTATMDGGAE